MKIFLSGGSGFIGKNFIEMYSDKYTIIAPSHAELDITDDEMVHNFFKEKEFDAVIHAANYGGKRNETHFQKVLDVNLRMFFNLVQQKKHYRQMIFLGSGAEYDKRRDISRIKETDFGMHVPIDEYGFSKFICSRYIQESTEMTNLRLFGVYGRYEDYNLRFISNILCRIIHGLPIEVSQNICIDYVWVNDLCRIIEYFVEHKPKKKVYNIGDGSHRDLLSLLEIIRRATGTQFKVNIKKEGMNKEYTCDNSVLMNELAQFRFTEPIDTIKDLYGYYLENKSHIDKENLIRHC